MWSFLRSVVKPSVRALLRKVRRWEADWQHLSDHELRGKTDEFRNRLADGDEIFELLPEAFACVVLVAERTVGMRHFDVQVQGGIELAKGNVVEMKTGEGKTLVATLPAYLHALAGHGVHIVTVNDYLARRDAEWMGPIYDALGLSVGVIQERMGSSRVREISSRRAAYACDVTYVTNSELVFDSLRDNLASHPEEIVQRGHHFAIVDEVDLLLIDEARTPLIISGRGDDNISLIRKVDALIRSLDQGQDYEVDERHRSAFLTERGRNRVESALGVGSLHDVTNLAWTQAIYQALQAYGVYRRDIEYIVTDGEIHIVDEHTGRVSPEKRYSNGLHQAIEAKEGVAIRNENHTLAKTSYQFFFRGYAGLCGMTGTARSEHEEFRKIYQLKVVSVPTNKPMIREDYERIVYVTMEEKLRAVIEEIIDAHESGRPVLVGTVSVRESEALSARLKIHGVKHNVLNARHHEHEAVLIARAGIMGSVTISTNMAGRGTDIVLGGSPQALTDEIEQEEGLNREQALALAEARCAEERARILEAGGLLVVGTGEHDSVRIDDQLRGRSGRQGDPGSTVYFVSLEDPVYQKFGQKAVLPALFDALAGHPGDEPVEAPTVVAALTELRRKVEVENEAIRLNVFKYDAVVHDRRERIWGWRRKLLTTQEQEAWTESVGDLIDDLLARLEEEAELAEAEAGTAGRSTARERWESILCSVLGPLPSSDLRDTVIVERQHAVDILFERYLARHAALVAAAITDWERLVLLNIIDELWTQYLHDLERVEDGIWMSSYAQRDPFVEFRKEAAVMFGQLLRDIEINALRTWLSLVVKAPEAAVEAAVGVGSAESRPFQMGLVVPAATRVSELRKLRR